MPQHQIHQPLRPTREQEAAIERLSEQNARLHVGRPFRDHVEVTAFGGRCWHVTPAGIAHDARPNHSIDWSR